MVASVGQLYQEFRVLCFHQFEMSSSGKMELEEEFNASTLGQG